MRESGDIWESLLATFQVAQYDSVPWSKAIRWCFSRAISNSSRKATPEFYYSLLMTRWAEVETLCAVR